MAFLLQGVIGGGSTLNENIGGMNFKGLLGIRGEDDIAIHHNRRAHIELADLFKIVQFILLKDHLQILEAGAVVEFDEAQGLGHADGLDPAADRHRCACVACNVTEQFFQFCFGHGL